MTDISEDTPQILFRAAKRRKLYRKRIDEEDVDDTPAINDQNEPTDAPQATNDAGDTEESESPATTMAEILKKRKLVKLRRAGIEFSNSAHSSAPRTPQPNALASAEPEMTASELAASRFTRQTGVVADAQDKHM